MSMKRLITILVLCLALFMLITGNLWGPLETSEARYAEISREMYESGDWLHPTLLNIYHYHKPPVTYWITAFAYRLFGVNFFAFRFFLVVAWVINCFLVIRIASMLLEDDETAWLSGLIFSTFPLVLTASRGLTTDTYLLTCILASVFCWIKFVQTWRIVLLYAFAVFLGLGFLTKGPVTLVLPAAVVISLLKWHKTPVISSMHLAGALLTFMAFGLGWFILLVAENDRLLDYFFFRHFVDRVADASVFSRSKPFYYYLVLLPPLTLPWFVPLVFKLPEIFKRPGNPVIIRVLIYWLLLPLLVFSAASSKLPLYILPLFPALSLYIAFVMKEYRHTRIVLWSMFLTNLTIYVALSFGHVLLTKQFNVYIAAGGVVCLIFTVIIYLIPYFHEKAVLQSVIFAGGLLFISTVYFRTSDTSAIDTQHLAETIQNDQLQGRKIFVFDEILPSLAFHLKEVPVSVYNGNKNLKRETEFEMDDRWKSYFIDLTVPSGQKNLTNELQKSAVVVCHKDKFSELKPFLPEDFSIKETGNRILVLTGKYANEN